jgi:hypothetical protein
VGYRTHFGIQKQAYKYTPYVTGYVIDQVGKVPPYHEAVVVNSHLPLNLVSYSLIRSMSYVLLLKKFKKNIRGDVQHHKIVLHSFCAKNMAEVWFLGFPTFTSIG